MRFERSVHIDAPAHAIWVVMSDVASWPTWTASITSVEREAKTPLAVGEQVVVRQPKLPRTVWTVTDVQPGRSFTWEATGPGVRTIADHTVEPNGGLSTVRLTIDQQGPLDGLIGRLTKRLTTKYLTLEAEGLKEFVEQRA